MVEENPSQIKKNDVFVDFEVPESRKYYNWKTLYHESHGTYIGKPDEFTYSQMFCVLCS